MQYMYMQVQYGATNCTRVILYDTLMYTLRFDLIDMIRDVGFVHTRDLTNWVTTK